MVQDYYHLLIHHLLESLFDSLIMGFEMGDRVYVLLVADRLLLLIRCIILAFGIFRPVGAVLRRILGLGMLK